MIIQDFSIKNFRSLKDIKIKKFNPITILHGDNDAGKSNILTALEIIFSLKNRSTSVASSKERRIETRNVNFWDGGIDDFTDNFYVDSAEPISFLVSVRFFKGEIKQIIRDDKFAELVCKKGNNPDDLKIKGEIVGAAANKAYQELVEVRLNNKIMFRQNDDGSKDYFPEVDVDDTTKYTVFETLMSSLNDLFTLVPSRRYLVQEMDKRGEEVPLDPTTFKNWLFNLQMNRETFEEYEEIKRIFKEAPLNFGEISFSRDKGNIEIFVKRGNLRLPIGRLGTGVQQILYLVSSLVHNKGKILGIEEMEINLSEASQNNLLHILNSLVGQDDGKIKQIIMSSHSYEYGKQGQVLRWWVSHNGEETQVSEWNNDSEAFLMRIRLGRLLYRLENKDLKALLMDASTKDEINKLIRSVFTAEEIKEYLK